MNEVTTGQPFRRFANADLEFFSIGLGCMGMSGMYGLADESESVATIQMAIDRGVTLIDTGDFYGMGHNEMLIARAIRGRRHKVQLSVKFGALRGPDGAWLGFDSRPLAVKNFLAYSLARLGTDYIDIYRPARLDPKVSIEDTIGAISKLVDAGYVRHAGLSEVGEGTIRRAHAVHPIADLQIEYSLMTRSVEAKILPVLNELGIGMTAYGVLARGLISGASPSQNDYRSHLPRFVGDNFAQNTKLAERLNALARERNTTATQLAIAWVLSRGENILPIPGCRNRCQLAEALGALELRLSAEELATLEEAVPYTEVAGTRYDSLGMRALDSER